VSPWIWLYCVITAALTGLLYVTWAVLCRKLLRDPHIGYPSFTGPFTTQQALVEPRDAVKSSHTVPGQPSGDTNQEAVNQDEATYETHYEPTWFPSRIGWPLEDDQRSICPWITVGLEVRVSVAQRKA
jgi:hypothetical protein